MQQGQEITVLGAGIAGLAAARALALKGAAVTVLEQAPEITEVGAGLQVSPNGYRVLRALGLGEAADRAGLRAEAVELYDGTTGSRVARLPLSGRDGGYRFFHRADLIALLDKGARASGAGLRLLHKVSDVAVSEIGARLTTTTGEAIETPLLIGADGLHSRVRAALNGTVAPFFTHQVAWRAVLPAEGAIPPVARVYMGPGRHIVTYPLRGGTLRNIVAVEERRTWVEESWTLTDDSLAMRFAFADFIPEVRRWLDRIDEPNLWGLFRHPVAATWHRHGAAILGDAAHPTLPFLAQGANMALEDAWVLAHELGRAPVPEALAAYQAQRAPRCRRIVEAANANARHYHLSGLKRDIAHLGLGLMSRLAPARLTGRFDWVYDHDVTTA